MCCAIYFPPVVKSLGAMSFFAGYECESYNNPADFFLDVINGDSTAVTSNKIEEIDIGRQSTVSF